MGSSPTQPHHRCPDLNPASPGSMYRQGCLQQAGSVHLALPVCQHIHHVGPVSLQGSGQRCGVLGGGRAAELLWALTRWHGAGLQQHQAQCRLQVRRAAAARDPPPPEHVQRGIRRAINPRSRSSWNTEQLLL